MTKVIPGFTDAVLMGILRRFWCMEVIGEVGEGTGKSDKKLMEDIGLETDEDYGVVKTAFPQIH